MSIFEGKIGLLPYILPARVSGRVRRVIGLVVEASAMPLPVGSLCRIHARLSGAALEAEVVGFREDALLLMPLGNMQGVGPGDLVECLSTHQTVAVGPHLLGRVLDAMGQPLDDKGPIYATAAYP
ncbi:MAG: EscN/YscN/HrcN family type III secretion system ATPase, partial [Planctomycetota bacterium]|nr:EscN/YscN/HrcN family type III secretion system ATPase [Planctomycetota bacterium]